VEGSITAVESVDLSNSLPIPCLQMVPELDPQMALHAEYIIDI